MQRILFACVLYCTTLVTATAAPIISSSTGLTNPVTTITFGEVPVAPNVAITNEFGAHQITFGNAFMDGVSGSFPNALNPYITNFNFNISPNIVNPLTIHFASPISSVAFSINTNEAPPNTVFQAYLNGGLVESFSAPTSLTSFSNFYGFRGITFDEIRIEGGGSNGAIILDKLQLGSPVVVTATPEPATFVLFGGLLAVGTYAVRLRKLRIPSSNE